MKNITRLLFLISFLTFHFSKAKAQVTNADSMVHKIFTVLKNKDEKGMVALYPNKEQMTRLFSRVMSALVTEVSKIDTTNKNEIDKVALSNRMLEKMKEKSSDAELEKQYQKVAKDFQQMIQQGEKMGIQWNDITLTNFTINKKELNDEGAMKIFGSSDVKEMKGTIDFTANHTAYQISFADVLYLPEEGGWFGGRFQHLKKKEKTNSETTSLEEMTDTPAHEIKPAQKSKATIKSKSKKKA